MLQKHIQKSEIPYFFKQINVYEYMLYIGRPNKPKFYLLVHDIDSEIVKIRFPDLAPVLCSKCLEQFVMAFWPREAIPTVRLVWRTRTFIFDKIALSFQYSKLSKVSLHDLLIAEIAS